MCNLKERGMLISMKKNPIILFGAGSIGIKALFFYGDRVKFFVDSHKSGMYYGVPIISFSDLQGIGYEYDLIISTGINNYNEINQLLVDSGIEGATLFKLDSNDVLKIKPNSDLQKFKNIHNGNRCFIIGNGSSLKSTDLDKIKQNGEISFGSNGIYKIYDSTEWRPNYYFCQDTTALNSLKSLDIDNLSLENGAAFLGFVNMNISFNICKFLTNIKFPKKILPYRVNYLNLDVEKNQCIPYYEFPNTAFPEFSFDISEFVYSGRTVTYSLIQFATYMGISELYLLGVDNDFLIPNNLSENSNNDRLADYQQLCKHFTDDYYKHNQEVIIPPIKSINTAYEYAEKCSREHGFRIFNATRGGNLEIFERVNFDNLFND